MNFIITGGSGFIGSHLTMLLSRLFPEDKIYNLDLVAPDSDERRASSYPVLREGETLASEHVEVDVRRELPELPFTPTPDDVIFNLAAIHRTPGYADHEYFDTNVAGAHHVCEFADKWGIKTILFTSSIDVYGASEELKDENFVPQPRTAYGKSKLEAERIHIQWQEAQASSRRLIIFRPGVVFGRGENGNYTRLFRSLKSHKFAYPGRTDTLKASIYVKDLVNFMVYSLEHAVPGVEVFNCCYFPAATIKQIVDIMKRTTGIGGPVIKVPSWLIMGVAHVAKAMGSPLGICPARVKKLQISTNASGEKMLKSGYPFLYSFEEALADWYKDNDNKYLQ